MVEEQSRTINEWPGFVPPLWGCRKKGSPLQGNLELSAKVSRSARNLKNFGKFDFGGTLAELTRIFGGTYGELLQVDCVP
jgi:hypothetical protein